jgi:hypothetical protein
MSLGLKRKIGYTFPTAMSLSSEIRENGKEDSVQLGTKVQRSKAKGINQNRPVLSVGLSGYLAEEIVYCTIVYCTIVYYTFPF